MKLYLHGHASHRDGHMAVALAAAQIEAQHADSMTIGQPTIGWLYLTDHLAGQANALLADVRRRWPGTSWVGAVGVGIAGNGIEYVDEPAVSIMLGDIPRDRFRVFSGLRPLSVAGSGRFHAATAQVHADPATSELTELIGELAERTSTGYLFGGLALARVNVAGNCLHIADGIFEGGLSGVAFSADVTLVSRVTQGCQPIGPVRHVTAAQRNVILTLDDKPALDCLLHDIDVDDREPRAALLRLRQTLVGLSDAHDDVLSRAGQFGADTRVRHLIGLDPAHKGVAIGDVAPVGAQVAFCTRNPMAARRDLVRICAEIREELEPETLPLETALALQGNVQGVTNPARQIAGAVYVSCAGRGGAHFGAPSAELAIVRQALGDVPLTGFFASGEIARHHVYGYTGVLTVFTA